MVSEAVVSLNKDSARKEAGKVALEIKQEFMKRELALKNQKDGTIELKN